MLKDKSSYAKTIKSALEAAAKVKSGDQTQAIADAIAGAMMDMMKDAEVPVDTFIVPMGIAVATAGTPAAQTGVTTAPGTVTGSKKLL